MVMAIGIGIGSWALGAALAYAEWRGWVRIEWRKS